MPQSTVYAECTEILYLSPNDQPFLVRQDILGEDLWLGLLHEEADTWEWLERADAPDSAYAALGLRLEEG